MERELYIFRCGRCCALFAVTSMEETRGGHNKSALLEANGCEACGKGVVEYVGTLQVKV